MKWISIKDELPEFGEPVLIFSDDYEFGVFADDGQWYEWGHEYDFDCWLAEGEVTHWMRLEEPES